MPASVRTSALRSPFLWVGLLLLVALGAALVFSDGVAELARYSADYQRRINQVLSTSLRDVQSGTGSLALWTLVTVCFGYGVVHTLGPGHGKAVVGTRYWKAHMIEYGTGPDTKDGSRFGPNTPTPEFAPGAKTAAHFGGTLDETGIEADLS